MKIKDCDRPFQGLKCFLARCCPRALPWAGLLAPLRGPFRGIAMSSAAGSTKGRGTIKSDSSRLGRHAAAGREQLAIGREHDLAQRASEASVDKQFLLRRDVPQAQGAVITRACRSPGVGRESEREDTRSVR